MNRYFFFTLIIFLMFTGVIQLNAQIPRTLSYQGVLTDTTGNPKPDGLYNLVFRMYDVASGGTALWSESETVATKRGLFSSILGDGTAFPSSMNFNEQYWLSIQVDSPPELSPRIPLTAVGYSMHSISADTAYVTIASIGDTLWKKSGANIYRLTGKVGIGTSDPQAKLDVSTPEGTLPLYLNQFANHTYTPTMIQMADAQGIVGIIGVLSASGELGMIGNNSLSLKTGSGYGTFGIHINNSGNVGIGTLSPDKKLRINGTIFNDVFKTSRVGSNHFIEFLIQDAYDNSFIHYENGSSSINTGIQSDGNYFVDLKPGSTSGGEMSIYNGNVGIGTNQPSQPLHIVGPLRWQNSSGSVIGELNFDTGADLLGIGNSIGGDGSAALGFWSGGIERIRLDQGGNVGIGTTTPGYKLDVNGDLNLAAGSVYRIGGVIQTGSSKWTAGTGDNIYRLNGYVGIGTTNPLTSLHIANVGWVGMNIQTLTSAGVRGSYLNFGDLDDVNVGAILYDHTNNLMGFNTDDTTRMVITHSGNVGIGTTTPQEEIHIAGTSSYQLDSRPRIRIENLNTSGDNGTAIGFQGRNAWFALGTDLDWDGSDNLYILDGHTQEASFLINSLGYVGIGTTNPTSLLHLVKNQNLETTVYLDNNDAGNNARTYFSAGEDLSKRGGFGYTNSGFAPILGEELVAANSVIFNSETQVNNGIRIIAASPNAPIIFGTGGYAATNERMRITSTGNVGIGLNNPTRTLEIKIGGTTLADAWSTRSSRRWKTNIEPLQGSLEKVEKLQGVSFNWKETGKSDIGLIAEEVGTIVPEVVTFEDNGIDAKSIDYAKLVALLIEAVKDQQKQIDELKAEMNSLSSKPTE